MGAAAGFLDPAGPSLQSDLADPSFLCSSKLDQISYIPAPGKDRQPPGFALRCRTRLHPRVLGPPRIEIGSHRRVFCHQPIDNAAVDNFLGGFRRAIRRQYFAVKVHQSAMVPPDWRAGKGRGQAYTGAKGRRIGWQADIKFINPPGNCNYRIPGSIMPDSGL